jgi:hypothetical protein
LSNNGPYVMVPLTKEQFDFLLDNCDTNMGMGLGILLQVRAGVMSRSAAEKTVALVEQFKGVKQALKQAEKER